MKLAIILLVVSLAAVAQAQPPIFSDDDSFGGAIGVRIEPGDRGNLRNFGPSGKFIKKLLIKNSPNTTIIVNYTPRDYSYNFWQKIKMRRTFRRQFRQDRRLSR